MDKIQNNRDSNSGVFKSIFDATHPLPLSGGERQVSLYPLYIKPMPMAVM